MRKIIQIGVGSMGRTWTDAVAASAYWSCVAYVDLDRKALMAAAEEHGMPRNRCFTDLGRALRLVEADALLDITPQQCRKEVCSMAFKAGLHVLSEKPLADTMANARLIVKRAAAADRRYMVAQNYRYRPVVETVRRQIERGRIGQVGYVGISFHKGPHFGGFREVMPYPLLLDMSIHHFDMLRCILGEDIEWVSGVSVNSPWNWNKGDATAMIQLATVSGIAVNYCASWVSTGWETTWNADWRIEGDKGVLIVEGDQVFFSDAPARRRKVPLVKMALQDQPALLAAFRETLDRGEEPATSGRRNLNSLATTHAVVRAVRQKRKVAVKELLD